MAISYRPSAALRHGVSCPARARKLSQRRQSLFAGINHGDMSWRRPKCLRKRTARALGSDQWGENRAAWHCDNRPHQCRAPRRRSPAHPHLISWRMAARVCLHRLKYNAISTAERNIFLRHAGDALCMLISRRHRAYIAMKRRAAISVGWESGSPS